jgi:uncharacterized protein YbjT (DUF2867 family)
MNNILVLGGTGFVGRALCERLVERSGGAGGRITVVTRHLPRANAVRLLPTVEVLPGSVHDEAFLRQQVQRHDAVVNLVAILHGSAQAFEQVHVALPQKLAAAARAAGGKRLVHISALGIPVDGAQPPSNYLRSKAAGERVLRDSGLEPTVLRPSVIFGAEDRFLNLFAQLQRLAPLLPLAGRDARFQPVWVSDVASAIVACLEQTATAGQTIQCAGPKVYTLGELVQLAGRWAGVERPQVGLPAALAKLQALFMELLPGEPLMSRDNVDSMSVPNIAEPGLPGLESLGITPAPLEAVAPEYLHPQAGRGRYNRHRAFARRD